MRLSGLVGQTYQLRSKTAAAERCINWFPTRMESDAGTNTWILEPTPGLQPYAYMPGTQGRGCFAQDGRAFAIVDRTVYEITPLGPSGAVTPRGTVAFDSLPATFCSNGTAGNQLLITAGGKLYTFDLAMNVLTDISGVASVPVPAKMCGFTDGYGIVLVTGSRTFQISALEDFSTWNGLDASQISESSDNLLALLVDHREIWLFGSKCTEVWRNTGGADNPFEPIAGGFIEHGIIAPFSACKFDNTVVWVGGNTDRGAGVAFRANGYTPQRISTHAVEETWQSYEQMDDAIGWVYQEDGHEFWGLNFPSGETSWVYDAASQQWHERAVWDPPYARWRPQIPQYHMFVFGKHLVQDRQSGMLYEQNTNITAYNVFTTSP